MSRARDVAETSRPVVLRQTGAVVVPIAVWGFCVLAVVDAVVEGTPRYVAQVVLVMGIVALACWLVLASPCLEVGRAGLRVVNPVRVHHVPFEVLEEVQVRGLTTVVARTSSGEHRITSWNAPGAARGREPSASVVRRTVEERRSSWERSGRVDPDAALRTDWRWLPVTILAVLTAFQIAIWLR